MLIGVVVPSKGPKTAVPFNNPSLVISPMKVDGSNYLAWSYFCKLFIKVRGLEDYIIGMKTQKLALEYTSSTMGDRELSCDVLADQFNAAKHCQGVSTARYSREDLDCCITNVLSSRT